MPSRWHGSAARWAALGWTAQAGAGIVWPVPLGLPTYPPGSMLCASPGKHAESQRPPLCPCPTAPALPAVYLYDLRHTAAPLCSFPGHHKAVSYVRFCSAGELLSASTDSTLRLWPLPAGAGGPVPAAAGLGPCEAGAAGVEGLGGGLEVHAERIYEGHTNEKNFVGLAGEHCSAS